MDTKEKENTKELSGLSERFLAAIAIVGYTGYRLAEEIDVISSPILTHIRTGRNEPSTKIIIAFLDKFRFINARWLLTGEGNPKVDLGVNDLTGVSYSEILHEIPITEIVAHLQNNEVARGFDKDAAYNLFLELRTQGRLIERMKVLEAKMDEVLKNKEMK